MNPVQILIYGTIGGELLSADICKAVLAAGESPIVARINSPGGSVFEAYAIYNAFAAHKPGVEVVIDGIAASAASYIAMAGKPVKMAANAMFMAHNPSSWEGGDSEALRKQADLLDKVKASLVSAYAAKTGRSPEEIAAELDNDEFIDAETAKARGYVDEIFDPMEMAAKFDFKAFKNQPKITALRSFTADLRAGDALRTGVPDGWADLVLCTMALHWMPDRPGAIREMSRALRPGGVLIYETFAAGNERYGRPRNPEFLLQPGELLEWARGHLRVVAFEDLYVDSPKPAMMQRICALHPANREISQRV